MSYPASTGRNTAEVLRVVDSLQTGDKHKVTTPINWVPGMFIPLFIFPNFQSPFGLLAVDGLVGFELLTGVMLVMIQATT